MDTDHDALSDRVSAQGVRDLLDGKLTEEPLPGTLADRVAEAMIDLASKTLVAYVRQQ